ncbi:MAG: class I adenylate-forming enzyme family protein [Betaproteobacteria bacterium]
MSRIYTSHLSSEAGLADRERVLMSLPRRICDIPALAGDPAAVALRHEGFAWTYAALDEAARGAAAALGAAGVRGGDRVMIVGENCPELLVLLFAVTRLDAWPVILNARLSPREVDAIAAHCTPRRAVFLACVSDDAAAHAARVGAHESLALGGKGGAVMTLRNDGCIAEPVHADAARQVGALIYTSGTTGDPKGVMLSHRNLLFIARISSALRALRPTDRVYGVLPISHVYGLASVSLGTLYGGACLELQTRYTPQAMRDALYEDGGLSMLQGVPPMYAKLLDLVDGEGEGARAPRLRACFSGGAPLDAALKRRFEQRFGVTLHNGYGLTEASPTIAHTRLDSPRADCAVGPLLPGVEARLVDPRAHDRCDAPEGEPGELWVRGPNVMLGYYRNAALSAATIDADGWLNTGDLAHCDTDGTLRIVGRTKELIIRSGFNVYPAEVEAVLNAHPAILLSAVVGRAVDGNEEVVAFVELRPGCRASPTELATHARSMLAPYKQPAEIRIVDALPVAANGKVLKHRLAQHVARAPAASV